MIVPRGLGWTTLRNLPTVTKGGLGGGGVEGRVVIGAEGCCDQADEGRSDDSGLVEEDCGHTGTALMRYG